MALKPTALDVEKIHLEVNQIMNQRFVLTTFAVTVFGAIVAWLLQKTPMPGGPVGTFVCAVSMVSTVFLFTMSWLHLCLKKYARVLTTYLRVSKQSGWEVDWAEYRIGKHFTYTGYQYPQTWVLALLGVLAGGYPIGILLLYSLRWEPLVGIVLATLAGVGNVSFILKTGFSNPDEYESFIHDHWTELNNAQ
jgi:hypothetical protein